MTCPPEHNKSRAFWLEEWNGDEGQPPFSDLPQGFQKLIRESDEYHAIFTGGDLSQPSKSDAIEDDIPF